MLLYLRTIVLLVELPPLSRAESEQFVKCLHFCKKASQSLLYRNILDCTSLQTNYITCNRYIYLLYGVLILQCIDSHSPNTHIKKFWKTAKIIAQTLSAEFFKSDHTRLIALMYIKVLSMSSWYDKIWALLTQLCYCNFHVLIYYWCVTDILMC